MMQAPVPDSSGHAWADTFINAIVALATIAAVIAAVFPDGIRRRFHPLKLVLEMPEVPGTITEIRHELRPMRAIHHTFLLRHLRVVNQSSENVAQHCRAMLVAIEKQIENGAWTSVALPVPLQLPWAPQGLVGHDFTLVSTGYIDFVELHPRGWEARGITTGFRPTLYAYPNDFKGAFGAGERCRYFVEIHAENLPKPPRFAFEVAWDGFWHNETTVEEMADHFTVRRLRMG